MSVERRPAVLEKASGMDDDEGSSKSEKWFVVFTLSELDSQWRAVSKQVT